MTARILLVDDDENILQAYTRNLRKRFDLDTANSGLAALGMLAEKGPYQVIVADMRMPGMDGIKLLAQVKAAHPDVVRIMLTGNADQATAKEAVNQGAIFRFLTKPCEPEILALSLDAALDHHARAAAERELLEQTLQGSIRMVMDLLSVLAPASLGRCNRLRDLAVKVGGRLAVAESWHLGVAALMSQLGLLTLPYSLAAKLHACEPLDADEQSLLDRVPGIGAQLIRNIPRLEPVADIVYYSQKQFDGGGFPEDSVQGLDIPIGARVLHVLADFMRQPAQRDAHSILSGMALDPARYDPAVVAALKAVLEAEAIAQEGQVRRLLVSELRAGQTLVHAVETLDGWLVAPEGTVLGQHHLELIRNFHRVNRVREPVQVLERG
jgi:response regulator RpfG family c-di-GMP phosphodiesterase